MTRDELIYAHLLRILEGLFWKKLRKFFTPL